MKPLAILMLLLMLGCERHRAETRESSYLGFLMHRDSWVAKMSYKLQFKIPLVGPLTCVAKFDPPIFAREGDIIKVRATNRVEFANNKRYSAKCVLDTSSEQPKISGDTYASADGDLDCDTFKSELSNCQQQRDSARNERDRCLKTEVCPLCNKRHNEN